MEHSYGIGSGLALSQTSSPISRRVKTLQRGFAMSSVEKNAHQLPKPLLGSSVGVVTVSGLTDFFFFLAGAVPSPFSAPS